MTRALRRFYGASAGLGHADLALEWLEKARSERDCWLPLVPSDPAFDPVLKDSRFVRQVEQLGLKSNILPAELVL
ncbi:MAG: hypothetical protein HY735_23545 [Verrucomicrobia bacterium]|nr:hypothetical protein [Verrucomicrobiota bacterium]